MSAGECSALEAAFWGRVTAGLGHELNNVLATVDGLAGLQDDLLSLAAGAEGTTERLGTAAAGIEAQVVRGKALTELLRALAHSADDACAPLDLATRLAQAVGLCRRFAALAEVELVLLDGGALPAVTGRALDVLHVACRCLFAALAAAPRGSEAVLGAEESEAGWRLRVACASAPEPSAALEDELHSLAQLARHLGGDLGVQGRGESRLGLAVELPIHVASGATTRKG